VLAKSCCSYTSMSCIRYFLQSCAIHVDCCMQARGCLVDLLQDWYTVARPGCELLVDQVTDSELQQSLEVVTPVQGVSRSSSTLLGNRLSLKSGKHSSTKKQHHKQQQQEPCAVM
jgi:hypothetical protein